jgi:murein DD-endopeptidase MepM/ murein hydrolase activator NlpD
MRGQRTRNLTVLLVRADGRGTWQLKLPRWTPAGLRSCAALALFLAAFFGWQLQALCGMYGPRVQLAMRQNAGERWATFERMAPEGDGPTRSELRRQIARARAARLDLGNRRAASLLWAGTPDPAWVQDAERVQGSRGTLLWPIQGGLYGRGYGSGAGGYHLAIDIDGQRGSEVMAAAAGTVGYAGHELRGYGNLLMVVHAGGLITLYAHNQRLLVVAGEHVQQGQAIAELGSTGRSMGPHVHFELIHDGRNCDPVPLFRYEAESRPERFPLATLAQWLPDQPRPSNVRCARRKEHPRTGRDKDDLEFAPEDDAEPAIGLHGSSVGPMALGGRH